MRIFVKKLAANELGFTRGHQEGGINIPKPCVTFFPELPDGVNPEISIRVSFEGLSDQIPLRFIYYNNKTRNEYRMRIGVPHLGRFPAGTDRLQGREGQNRGQSWQPIWLSKPNWPG